MKAIALTIFAVALSVQVNLGQRGVNQLVGTWRLVSAFAVNTDGRRTEAPYGPNPTGLITYTDDGRMSAVISYGGRRPLTEGDRVSAPESERAEAFATSFGYAGRYSFSGSQVTHHVEVSTVQNWVDTDLVRTVALGESRLTLRTPPMSVGGATRTTQLIFERVK